MKLFIKRLAAYWLDFVMLSIVILGFQWILYTITTGFPFDYFVEGYQIELWVMLTISLPVWLYFILSEFKKQKTLGKWIFKLTVTDERGSRISFTQAFLRTLIKLLPWELTHLIILIPDPWWSTENPQNTYLILIPNIIIILYILILFITKGRKTIHDSTARTRVSGPQ